jgi:hypothetical protein
MLRKRRREKAVLPSQREEEEEEELRRVRRLRRMEKARRSARRSALRLVRRAGARRSLEKERGRWLRMCPRRGKETGAGSILRCGGRGHACCNL